MNACDTPFLCTDKNESNHHLGLSSYTARLTFPGQNFLAVVFSRNKYIVEIFEGFI